MNIIKKCAIKKRGFTLIEILVVIGIIAVLAAVVIVAINPGRQFKLARDSQRVSNINAILNSIGQNMAENKGIFMCIGNPFALPTAPTVIKNAIGGADIAKCIVPTYVSVLPFDPSATGAHFTDVSSYDTGYSVSQDSQGRVTVSAVGELTTPITVTR